MDTIFKNRKTLLAFILLIMTTIPVLSQAGEIPKPSKKDKCPVCGMFVYKYPDWMCSITFKDGSTLFFDGAKDLFKFYLDIDKYDSSRSVEDISSIHVMEYYNMKHIEADKAVYVIGSDILGPMGHELIAFETMDDAEAFKKDHKGRRIITFNEVDSRIIKKLDEGF